MGKNKLEAFKGFLIPKMVARFGSGALLHIWITIYSYSDGKRPGLYGDFHTGIDYAAPTGTPIPAQHPGLLIGFNLLLLD